MSRKTDYIHSKIDGLSQAFLNSMIELPSGERVRFSEYCLDYLPTVMDEDLRIKDDEFINDIETLIMIQELDTGIDPHATIREEVTVSREQNVSPSKEQVVRAIKNEYRNHLDKIVDYGKSDIILGDAITELVAHTDANGLVNISGNMIPLPEIIDNLVAKANKTFNLIRADKIKLRSTGITSFGIDEMAISLNPGFDLENTYVRYFMETFERALSQTFDPEQAMELSENVISKINPKCTSVLASIADLTNKYVKDNQIFNDIMSEYGESRGVLR